MSPDPLFYLVASVAVICFGLAKGGFVGIGFLATPLLALVVPPMQAVTALLPIMLVQDAVSVWAYRKTWDRFILLVMLPGVLIGIGLAWLIVARVTIDSHIRIIVGLTVLALVIEHWIGSGEPRRPSAGLGVLSGIASGFAGLLANAASGPFLTYVLPQRLEKEVFVGTTAIFFAATDLIKVPPLVLAQQFTLLGLMSSALLLPLAIATNFLGIWLVRRTSTHLFYRVAYLLVFFVSLTLIWQGMTGINRGAA
jgi:uncharacterized membrane protein YfcA